MKYCYGVEGMGRPPTGFPTEYHCNSPDGLEEGRSAFLSSIISRTVSPLP